MKAPRLKPYVPPTQEPTLIKLNGYSSSPQPIPTSRAQQAPTASNGNPRPQPRVITELPPPTQLDIEWSPVLTRNNERILKLGNLMVLSTPLPHSPNSRNGEHGEAHEKKGLARFFGGSTTKKRQRLVMVTSSARIILAAAGGDEKKSKSEISLLASECSWRTQLDVKGQEVWCVDTVSMPDHNFRAHLLIELARDTLYFRRLQVICHHWRSGKKLCSGVDRGH
jgi:3-phosphoinositide dependent protein kinase-1